MSEPALLGSLLGRRAGIPSTLTRHRRPRTPGTQPEIVLEGKSYLNFSSNDYLGMSCDPRVLEHIRAETGTWGIGSGSAALLGGYSAAHAELERALAAETGHEAAVLFSSGYMANLGALTALLSRQDYALHDRLNHASLIDGILLSGARHRRYAHLDMGSLATALANTGGNRLIVTETVFSMDGDQTPLPHILQLAKEFEALTYLDDAHGFLVSQRQGPPSKPADVITMVTLGKALGAQGAAVCASEEIIDLLVQTARTFVYDTALSPVCALAALEALRLIKTDHNIRQRLNSNVVLFQQLARKAGIPLSNVEGPIQPIRLGGDVGTLAVAERLRTLGMYIPAIRPPTVPKGTSRLRITLTASHTSEHIERLVAALAKAIPGVLSP